MSDKAELPKKKATANLGRLDTQDLPAASSRKRKPARTTTTTTTSDGEAAASSSRHHAVVRTAQGRRSNLLASAAPAERQRQRPSQALPAHRRMSMDVHRPRRSHAGARPVRTKRAASVPPGPPRTMLQHAWHTVLNSDPLVDSDEECPDEHLRLEYNRRMQVITRLRGRPPTPEPECNQTVSS